MVAERNHLLTRAPDQPNRTVIIMAAKQFPSFLYAAAKEGEASDGLPYVKRHFILPEQVPANRDWFENRELTIPYEPPKFAPRPKTLEEEVAALRAAVNKLNDEKDAAVGAKQAAEQKAAALANKRQSRADE